jgi:predicted TIM-barrel fold metal-dependent hydrolase
MLIDFHTHAFPDAIAPRALGLLIERMERRQGSSIVPCADGTASGLFRLMDEEGVDASVLLPIATRPANTASVNRFAKSLEDDRIWPFGSVHPAQEDWEAALESVYECGMPGIKLHPEFQDFFVDSPECIRVLKKCAQLRLIVTFHAGEDVGYEPPIHATPVRLRRAMDAVPGATVVAAHMGGFRMWEDVQKYLVDTPCYIDTAYVQKEISPDACLHLIRLFGAERVLFASDSPWSRPRTETWAFLKKLGLSDAELQLISHQNALRLLKDRK